MASATSALRSFSPPGALAPVGDDDPPEPLAIPLPFARPLTEPGAGELELRVREWRPRPIPNAPLTPAARSPDEPLLLL